MLAAYAAKFDADDPISALEVGERPEPEVPEGWVTIEVMATALNHHDLWSLKGVGLAEKNLPMILGCDAAGVDPDGNEVVVHAVVSDPAWKGDETLDPKRSLLSERYQGTLAQKVAVPARNVVPKPAGLSFEQAACLPTAWLTAYRMLFTQSGLKPGDTVLVQGAGGGVASSLITLARAAGMRVWATSRDEAKRAKAVDIGAHEAFESGARMPERVDAVMETVGAATWDHSVKCLTQGGTIVVTGATGGHEAVTDLRRVFFLQLRVVGSTMGTRDELLRVARFCESTGIRPQIDTALPLEQARDAFAKLASGDVFGKVVLTRPAA
jgi:NADPH:quinone reductase-like Zn-dependent oxidoreductase